MLRDSADIQQEKQVEADEFKRLTLAFYIRLELGIKNEDHSVFAGHTVSMDRGQFVIAQSLPICPMVSRKFQNACGFATPAQKMATITGQILGVCDRSLESNLPLTISTLLFCFEAAGFSLGFIEKAMAKISKRYLHLKQVLDEAAHLFKLHET